MPGVFSRGLTYLKKHLWIPVVSVDLLMVSGIWFGKWVLQQMFRFGKPCNWTRFGAQCATCGGTRCVQAFLQGDFIGAFSYNPMVFCWILYGILSAILLNLHILCKQKWAGRVLAQMYSLTAFLIALGVYLMFVLLRNLPLLLGLIS